MKEEPVFWLGGRAGTKEDAAAAPEAQQLEPEIIAACRTQGLAPEDFVVALGGFGSWLVHFTRDGRRERFVWNGREQKLVLQVARRGGGWDDLRERRVEDHDGPAFTAAIAALMADAGPPAA